MPEPQYSDDPSILNDHQLWRRIFPGWLVMDDNIGGIRPSSQAFKNSGDGTPMSVTLGTEFLNEGGNPSNLLTGFDDYFLASLTGGQVRANQQGICRDPTPTDTKHALVFGEKPSSIRKAFGKLAVWIIPPPSNSAS